MRACWTNKMIILLCVFITVANNAHGSNDSSRVHIRTLGLVVCGIAFNGLGLCYEQTFRRQPGDEPAKRYLYWHGCVGSAGSYSPNMTTTIGTGFHQAVTRSRKFFIGGGVNAGLMINFNSTPKELRDYWDSIEFYGGNYVNPVEILVVPEVNVSYLGQHWFLRFQYTPIFATHRMGGTNIEFAHWGGLLTGYRF